MTQTDSIAPLADEPTGATPTVRDTQRTALADLLQLSRECSASEAELEAKHRQMLIDSRAKLESSILSADHRLETLKKQADTQTAEASTRVELEYGQESRRLSEQAAHRRTVANAAFEATKGDVKKKFDHATWLADSVLEAAELKANGEYRAELERHADQADGLGGIESEAASLVQRYGQQPEPVEERPPTAEPADEAMYTDARLSADKHLQALRRLGIARLFTGVWPFLIAVLICAAVAGLVQSRVGLTAPPDWQTLAYAVGGTFVGLLIVGIVLKVLITTRIKKTYAPLRESIAESRRLLATLGRQAKAQRDEAVREATAHRNADVDAMRQRLAPVQQKAVQIRDNAIRTADAELQHAMADLNARAARHREELSRRLSTHLTDAIARAEAERGRLNERFKADTTEVDARYRERRADLQRRWREGLADIQAPIGQDDASPVAGQDWRTFERNWQPPQQFPATIALGTLAIDLERISRGIPRDGDGELALPDRFNGPALLAFPSQGSLLIETDPDGREAALGALQMAMTRLLTQLPAGRARFTIIDAVGLGQSFAGFMHLADHDEQLVNSRIWTTPEQIDQRLTDLTEHMETVIQKYLRNEFSTIDEYNAQAGELAEPYRILVVADFPSGFEGESWRRLLSIARSGARCGVYTLILRDVRQPLPAELMIEDLESASTVIERKGGKFTWKDEVFGQFPLTLDPPPDEDSLTKIAHRVGKAAKAAAHVEVNFETIAPQPKDFWTQSAASELAVPIGRMGATRLQYFRCGKGVAQHSLVAGKTGSGKSTLLHAMVTNLAMWYSPDEVEFYLIDFKKGVEFKTYADYGLPHARAIAVESDREFGLSVLQRIDAELGRRGDLFRRAGVQDLAAYRRGGGGQVLPRVMLIIDEFQEFFTEDDKLSQEAQLLLDRLVRQGRAFGVHVFLGSQTIGGSGGLARTTIGQMGIRIALQTSEADSQLILGDSNSAARLLSRPGEAIYNDAGGAVENNSPFQVAWLSDERREKYLQAINDKLEKEGTKRPVVRPLVFEGNAPADLTLNPRLLAAVESKTPANPPIAWIGDPVAIKDPTGVPLRRQSGANLLIIGQADEQALGTLVASAISLATQLPPDRAEFVLFDGTPSDSHLAGLLADGLSPLPHKTTSVDYRDADGAIGRLADELASRQADANADHPATFVLINGLQRYRALRKGDDDGFSFSMSDEPKKASPSKQLVDLIREGPNYGIHVIVWCDTLASIERTFERGLMREFDSRVLFQMSANDSSNLIDSPAANKLGFFRALAYSEEQGVMEKFRPYGLPKREWTAKIAEKLT
ncbi:MAG TPA: FtsK/SpoIIIE domain-containing protein [Tepidisphaeraceae bacterium]